MNHGAGIRVADGGVVQNNFLHDNGQEGLSASGANVTVGGNRISGNNYAGFDPGWEAGGAKFSNTQNIVVEQNYVYDNIGPGLWTDIDNINSLYDSNIVINNAGEGIKHEISYAAVISNNTVYGNGGEDPSVWLWGAQILIQNSQNVQVYNNTVTVPASFGNGIAIIYQNRGQGAYGPWDAKNNSIHDNVITYDGTSGETGAAADWNLTTFYAWPNQFNHNSYHVTNMLMNHWQWKGDLNWSGFKAAGFEATGTIDTNIQ